MTCSDIHLSSPPPPAAELRGNLFYYTLKENRARGASSTQQFIDPAETKVVSTFTSVTYLETNGSKRITSSKRLLGHIHRKILKTFKDIPFEKRGIQAHAFHAFKRS